MLHNRILGLVTLLIGGTLLVAPASGQTLLWSDEFDDAQIDASVWTYGVGDHGFGNGELQYHTARPENAYIENGNLVIEARREGYFGKAFTSARLVTHGRLAFRYGTLEARIKLPDVDNGLWPAFWLLGSNIGQVAWPGCGEIDIMEVGRRDGYLAGRVNQRVVAAAHWDYLGSHASYGDYLDWYTELFHDYHVYKVEWTPMEIRAFIDGANFWTIDISDVAGSSLEEFHRPMFVILNLAVGGWNFVEITDPGLITAPFPARMYVDYVRLYDNGDTELLVAEETAETGNFGVFTENTPVNNSVLYEVDASLYLWNNLTPIGGDTFEGDEAWNMRAAAGSWFGMGVFSHVDRNMQHYSDGHLRFHMKTDSPHAFRIGIASSAAGEGWVTFPAGASAYGLVRDGQWHEVVIPLNSFLNVDFHTIKQLFMIAGDPPSSTFEVAIDDVYWSPSVPRPTPEHGSFGIFTEDPAHTTAGEYVIGLDGEFFIWENTLLPATENPYEGSASMSYTSAPGLGWFGAAFTPTTKYNLTAFRYPESRLQFAMKTTAPTTFRVGMRSGNVDDIGQKWILFEAGNDPYGFVRDGQWHLIEIPMTEIADAVDLSQVSLLFQILGVDGPIANIEIDDVCLLGGGAALPVGVPGDVDGDYDVDESDALLMMECMAGPDNANPGHDPLCFQRSDGDRDGDVDLDDVASFQLVY